MVNLKKRDAAIRRSKAPARELAEKHGISASRVGDPKPGEGREAARRVEEKNGQRSLRKTTTS